MVKGKCVDASGSYTDECASDGLRLIEKLCLSKYNECGSLTVDCKNLGFDKCENGRCVKETGDCKDSDEYLGFPGYLVVKGGCVDASGSCTDECAPDGLSVLEKVCFCNDCGSLAFDCKKRALINARTACV
jgi:hypothetical protein